MAWVPYDSFLKKLFTQADAIDFDDAGTTLKVMIATASYTPNRATHDFKDDATNEVTGTGYTAGGNAVANKTVTVAANVVTVDADDPATWAENAAGFSNGRIAVLYKDTGTAGTSPLIAYHDFTVDKGNVGGDLTVQLDALGIFTQSAS